MCKADTAACSEKVERAKKYVYIIIIKMSNLVIEIKCSEKSFEDVYSPRLDGILSSVYWGEEVECAMSYSCLLYPPFS